MAPSKFPFRGLAVKQTAITLLVALMVGLSIGAVEIVSEWYELRREVLRVVGQDIELVRASASEAAYQLNPGQAGNVVEGLLRLDYISRAELRDNFGNLLAQQRRPVVEDGNFWLGSRLLAGHEKGVMRLDRLSGAELTMVGHLEVGLDARSVGGRFIGVVISKVVIRVLWAILLSLLLAGVLLAADAADAGSGTRHRQREPGRSGAQSAAPARPPRSR